MKADVVIPVSPDAGWSGFRTVVVGEEFPVGAGAKSCAEGRAPALRRSSPLSEIPLVPRVGRWPTARRDCANRTLPFFTREWSEGQLEGTTVRLNALNPRNQ